jgi:hypothetical protein
MAGVGEMALDAYQETADVQWLEWADELNLDVLARAISDDRGTRWSNTEYTASPPELPPACGWMRRQLFLASTHALFPPNGAPCITSCRGARRVDQPRHPRNR